MKQRIKKYIHRNIEKEVLAAAREFPVVILTGPRQTGKSTLLQKIFPRHEYVTFDDPLILKSAIDDPRHFLTRESGMIIDEIQQAPEILPYLKMMADQQRSRNGRYILTGSQAFALMSGVSESLAGRAAVYELLGFSSYEANWLLWAEPRACFEAMFQGFYPELIVHGVDRNRFYSAYLQTYLERDIRQMTAVSDLKVFQNFLELLAARVGALLNLNEIAKECGISFTTVRRWLSLLETTRIVYLLRPYTRNLSKRVVKSPKLYFTDTGLLSFLLRYQDAATLQAGPQSGAFFENLVVLELLKKKWNFNLNYELFFYRDSNHNEVDIVVDFGQKLKLLEVKLTRTPRVEHFTILKKMILEWSKAEGQLLSFTSKRDQIGPHLVSLPWQQGIYDDLI